jgi:hypothetical protein
MRRLGRVVLCAAALAVAGLGGPPSQAASAPTPAAGKYRNFRAAIYVVVGSTKKLADPAEFEREFARISSQLKFDKVYVEVYRNHEFASDAEIEAVKRQFRAHGIEVSGGMTLAAGGQGGQFGTFDYESPADRAECQKAVELAARHFDSVIMDDFFFYTSKSDADIAAKGSRSWSQYRLDRMREVSQDLVLKPAKAANPNVKVVIKYPNWYEHFQGLGYDLDQEAQMFDGIYTGTETRDPFVTDQLLQQYESYGIVRYFDNIRPGGNGGGWVDTYDVRYVDRYAEQLWDTLFAKAPEITLFNWADLARVEAVQPGARDAWSGMDTTFEWSQVTGSYKPSVAGEAGPGWAHVAGVSLETVDRDLGALGRPIGIASYKPFQSKGEDFLQHYLGNIGLPIEMTPHFPKGADLVLLTEEAASDPDIVAEIKGRLQGGGKVVITSGFLKAMKGRGIEDIVEWEDTGRVAAIQDFLNGFGAGSGESLNDPAHPTPAVLFPEVRFYTNDSWPIIRGVAAAKGFPIMLMNRYSKGVIYLLNVPENEGDLYNLPQGVLTQVKRYLMADFPVRIESQSRVALFAYDNSTFVVESFRDAPETVTIAVAGAGRRLTNLSTGQAVAATTTNEGEDGRRVYRARLPGPDRTRFTATIQPHSYQVFRAEN